MGPSSRRGFFSVSLLLLLLALPLLIDAKYAKICDLLSSPVVSLEYDEATGHFTLADDDDAVLPNNGTETKNNTADDADVRRLVSSKRRTVQVGKHIMSAEKDYFLRANTNPRLQESTNPSTSIFSSLSSKKKTFIARACTCDTLTITYCLVDGIEGPIPDTCGVAWKDDLSTVFMSSSNNTELGSDIYNLDDVGCFELNSQTVFIRNAWPVVVLWYGALFIFILATSNGKMARSYLFNRLTNNRQLNRQVDRIMTREAIMRNRIRASALRTDGPQRFFIRMPGIRSLHSSEEERRWWGNLGLSVVDDQEPHEEVEYVLRTKSFSAEKERKRRLQNRARKINNVNDDNEDANEDANEHVSSTALTPTKSVLKSSGPSTPETVATATSLNDSDDTDQSDQNDYTKEIVRDANMNSCSEEEEEEEDTFECTICLAEVEDGEKIGVLSCHHIFHADCLRNWIARRNACPLCQVTEIASPRPIVGDAANEQGSPEEATLSVRERNDILSLFPSSNTESEAPGQAGSSRRTSGRLSLQLSSGSS